MSFSPIKQLQVSRTLSTGLSVVVGELAQNKKGVYFQYDEHYLLSYSNLSPFQLRFDASIQTAPKTPHNNLHGAFADSLPDGWGLLLMDRIFRQSGILPNQISAMDRLSFVGNGAMGALSFSPLSQFKSSEADQPISLAELGLKAQSIFDGQTQEILQALVAAGSSGGARPKAQLYFKDQDYRQCSTSSSAQSKAYLVKFTSSQLALGHEEGLCEAAYLSMAKEANIEVPQYSLLDAPKASGAQKWLALKRFDVVDNKSAKGRLHLTSASGLLDADYRMPSIDYEDLIKASSTLCKGAAAAQAMFRRMIFNLFALNQDDHSKNWAFLQDDHGNWKLSPFYDVTFSPSPHGEHATAFGGYGKTPPLKVIQLLARHAGFSSWKEAQHSIQETVEAINQFSHHAKNLEVSASTSKLISKSLNEVYLLNKSLLNA